MSYPCRWKFTKGATPEFFAALKETGDVGATAVFEPCTGDPAGFQSEDLITWYDHAEDIAVAMMGSDTGEIVLHIENEYPGDTEDVEFSLREDGTVIASRFRYHLVRDDEPISSDKYGMDGK